MPEAIYLATLLIFQCCNGRLVVTKSSHQLGVYRVVGIFGINGIILTCWSCSRCRCSSRHAHEVSKALIRLVVNLLHTLAHLFIQSLTLRISILQLSIDCQATLVIINGILLHVRKRSVVELISTFSDIRGLHLASFRVETWLALNDMTVRSKLYRLHLQAGVCLLIFHLVVETLCRSISLSKDVANIGCVLALVCLCQWCALRLGYRLGWLMHNRLVNQPTSRLSLRRLCSWLMNLLVWVPLSFTCSTCP